MAIVKFKSMESVVSFRLPSDMPPALCADGEVDSFYGLAWLGGVDPGDSPGSAPGSSGGSSGGSSSTGNSGSSPTVMRLSTVATGRLLPYGSRLLAVHSPAALHGERRYLLLTAADALAMAGESEGLTYLPGVVSRLLGDVKQAVVWRDFIFVIGTLSTAWVIFDSSTLTYSLMASAPTAPAVEFSLSEAHFPGYNSMAGEWPGVELAVAMPTGVDVDKDAIDGWLSGADAKGVRADVRSVVYAAVGKAFSEYIAKARAEGYILTPCRAVASYGGRLPTAAVTLDPGYQPPFALLDSWSYSDATLHMKVYFSLLPHRVSATFSIPQSMRVMARRLERVEFALGAERDWRPAGINTTAAESLTSYTDPTTSQRRGMAFRFPALSREKLLAEVAEVRSGYRVVGSVATAGATGGVVSLRTQRSEDPAYIPDYRDFTTVTPSGAAAVDQGIVVWGGSARIVSTDGAASEVSLRNRYVATDPSTGFLWRHSAEVADGEIVGIAQSSGARASGATGRHPLHMVATDGVRLLNTDGAGGYLDSRLLSRAGAVSPGGVAVDSDRVWFVGREGIWSVDSASKLELHDGLFDITQWSGIHALRGCESLLLRRDGATAIYDLRQLRIFEFADMSLRAIAEHEGALFTVASDGRLLTVVATRRLASDLSDTESGGDAADTEGDEGRRQAPVSRPMVRTRALKFGSPYTRKSVVDILPLADDAIVSLEGSDDLEIWHTLVSGARGAVRSLHTPSFRYHRLTMMADDPDTLRQVRIKTKTITPRTS